MFIYKKIHNSQIISKLVVIKLLRTIILLMRNFIANFAKILGICKDLAGIVLMNSEMYPDAVLFPSSLTSKSSLFV